MARPVIFFFAVLELCEKYKDIHEERIVQAKEDSQDQAARLGIIAATAVLLSFVPAILLALVLGYLIMAPVRRLTTEAGREGDTGAAGNEVKALSRSVRGLIQNADGCFTG